MQWLFVLVVFVLAYILIISGKFNRSTVAFAAGIIILLSKVIPNFDMKEIGFLVDFNTIGILIGMMIVVGTLRTTGFFEFVAVHVVRISKGNVRALLVFFMVTIALFSAFLDNVTTILLFAPIIFLVADSLEVSPRNFLLAGVLAANVGGTATLIGDPPNILVGSASGFGFMDFIRIDGPITLIALLITVVFLDRRVFKSYRLMGDKLQRLASMDPNKAIVSKSSLYKSLTVFFGIIAGFLLHDLIGVEPSLIALGGAAAAMILSGKSFSSLSEDIEWDTIFFFMGLFVLASALQQVGITSSISDLLGSLSGNRIILFLTLYWLSALMSGFIGAVPAVTFMIPVIEGMTAKYGVPMDVWWVISISACFGGSFSIAGAAANMVGVGLIEKHSREKLSYSDFLKFSMPLTIMTLAAGTAYILVRFSF
ncbi:citrate transporter [Mesotoga sp. Brook.08.YT.4.2.5.1]|jgi:Na+/H+ antiporter NhaD/arsenite permease-like protein|uniref:Na+/H+ antiporter NhaD-like permease n=1 Tax=Mesotoga prima TaxID=1184387 RepID=A0A101HLA4_9BACT|nr:MULTISPECIES: ArsB/NhaD family transporter [unclassified Mesotoga]KUK78874.1 MAG: Na+/H+ antiporter NhaD-like permease [Mesotoga prima]RAM60745.1 citrate transporter [Mesotoga sp. SC_4PWA21]PNE23172.1 citrate transporter [Mesotoga sp. Brook.08.YT.4.2.5.1]PNS42265.1 citrate transporter [Mesotoga sp. B105.6.4]PVD15740.1 citrate transporter [Mesotoga sp. Brook.08.105.5.1]